MKRWLLALILLLLACNLTPIEDETNTGGNGGQDVAQGDGTPPTVQVVAPQSGQQVVVGSEVEIQVMASGSQGVTRLQLSDARQTISTKSFPEPATNAEAILIWKTDREGTFSLNVIAFQGSAPSQPATLSLQVVGRNDPLTNPVTGQATVTGSSADCVARVLINNLRIRSGPGTGFSSPGRFDLNEQLTVVGINADDSWMKVRRIDSTENWVINNSEWVSRSGNCSGLPVVES